ncbi:hypothetical protein AcW1_002736 [Taiwanofungus camphoratus]|nr:hypothetical protein AcW1_002736 [Antrodia cinnamomea]
MAGPSSPTHLVLFAYEAWGHTRPLCNLAARFVKSRPFHVTFFTTDAFRLRVTAELFRSFEPHESGLLGLIRVVALQNGGAHPLDHDVLDASFADAYAKLVKSEAILCTHSGTQYAPLPPPRAAIIDFYASSPLQSVRKLSRKSVKVYAWYSGAASALPSFYGPEIAGGKGNLRAKIEAEVRRTGREAADVAAEISLAFNGSIMHIPGLPPMYDYEVYPQKTSIRKSIGNMMLTAYETFAGCDGVIMSTPECYEPQTLTAIRDLFARTSRSIWVCGPLLATSEQALAQEREQSSKALEIEEFMDSILSSHGKHSLVYFSLGSLYWSPSEPQKIWAFLDVLMEMEIPFIMSYASRWAVIPDTVVQKVNHYGLGFLSAWSPQQLILAHPVTGWFVTHGGHNSVVEAISQGIPMICWPFAFDQPTNSVHLTCNLDIAYELFEVRNAHGLKPVHRIGRAPQGSLAAVRQEARAVLEHAFGSEGQRKRMNAQRLKTTFARAWLESGEARLAIESFLDTFSSHTLLSHL